MRIVGLPKAFPGLSAPDRLLCLPKPTHRVESAKAHDRLRWLKAWQRLRHKGFSSGEAVEILKLPRSTLYRWQRRLKREGLRGLEDRSRRPERFHCVAASQFSYCRN